MSRQYNGIDISHWQGNVDFSLLKVDFIIMKAGGSDKKNPYTDRMFEENYAVAKAAGIPVGAYWFVGKHCVTAAAGKLEAEHFLECIQGKSFEMPVYIDIETTTTAQKQGATAAVIAFCDTMEKAGYYVGIYASDISGYKDRLDNSKLSAYDHWVARYGSSPQYVKAYGMWQYSSKGSVQGIKGNVDMDIAYINYPAVMKKKHLNHC